jgi:hypothetical protein
MRPTVVRLNMAESVATDMCRWCLSALDCDSQERCTDWAANGDDPNSAASEEITESQLKSFTR